jgi:alginate O-acetyltransferase complex protein AlgJ
MHDPASSRFSRTFAVAFLVIGALGALVSFRAIVSPEVKERLRADGPFGAVLDGRWSSRFQSGFEEALPFRDGAVVLWAAARYALFRSGAPGVVVGADGWLYTAEEFETHPDYEERLMARLGRVTAVRDALGARGIDLVVALVPSKARVQAGHLRHTYLRRRPPGILEDRYSTALALFSEAGVPAPDLRPALEPEGAFLRRDTHWTPAGAAAVAQDLAAPGREALDRQRVGLTPFENLPTGAVSHTGDLMAFLSLGHFAERFGLGPEEVRLFETRRVPAQRRAPRRGGATENSPPAPNGATADPLGLFDTPEIPVALVGTSYSADPRWNFASFLQEALQAEVLTVAEEGTGPFDPMEAYLEGDTLTEIPPRLVIWEIPERYLTVDPE